MGDTHRKCRSQKEATLKHVLNTLDQFRDGHLESMAQHFQTFILEAVPPTPTKSL